MADDALDALKCVRACGAAHGKQCTAFRLVRAPKHRTPRTHARAFPAEARLLTLARTQAGLQRVQPLERWDPGRRGRPHQQVIDGGTHSHAHASPPTPCQPWLCLLAARRGPVSLRLSVDGVELKQGDQVTPTQVRRAASDCRIMHRRARSAACTQVIKQASRAH